MKQFMILAVVFLSQAYGETGDAAVFTAETVKDPSHWQNWTFAATAAITAAAGVFLVSVDDGTEAH